MEDLLMATNTLTRYNARDVVPTRSLIDQLLEGSVFAPSMMDRWFNQNAPATSFPANLVENDEGYVVQIGLPGLNPEKLEIQSLNRELRIKGVFEPAHFEKGNYIWNGLPQGEFTQAFTLPAEVASDGAEATYTSGILTISLPKAEHAKVRNIPVKTTV
jgi:HSP20 family protein